MCTVSRPGGLSGFSGLVLLLLVALHGVVPGAFAAPPLPAPCLSPLGGDEPDPMARDVHFVVATTYIGATLCIASNNPNGFHKLVLTVNVFRTDGSFIASGGTSAENVGPMVFADPKQPKVVWPASTGIGIDSKYAGGIMRHAVIVLRWQACQAPLPACNAAAEQTTTFLMPITFDAARAPVAKK